MTQSEFDAANLKTVKGLALFPCGCACGEKVAIPLSVVLEYKYVTKWYIRTHEALGVETSRIGEKWENVDVL